jgi:hypothetical protein
MVFNFFESGGVNQTIPRKPRQTDGHKFVFLYTSSNAPSGSMLPLVLTKQPVLPCFNFSFLTVYTQIYV